MKRLAEVKEDDIDYHDRYWERQITIFPNGSFQILRLQQLLKHVKNGDKVVDLGAGISGSVEYAKEAGLPGVDVDTVEMHCLDESVVAKRHVDSKNLGIIYEIGDALNTPYPDNFFDVVTAGELIEHMEDPQALVNEMARICKPGGWLSISTVNPQCPNAIKQGKYIGHLWEFEPQDLLDIFNKVGKAEYYLSTDYHIIQCEVR